MSSFNWPPQASGAGGGVTSLNTLTGDIVLAAGTGITLTPVGQTITIAATTTGTVSSVGLALPSIFTVTNSPVTTTGTLTGTLNTQAANLVFAGPTTGVAATPTFRSLVSADISGLFGNLTDVGTDGIVITGGTGVVLGTGTSIAQHVADSTHNGYLSSTDWSTFNNKQASGNYITALTSDVTASGPGSVAATLATVNSNVGSFGSSTAIPAFTVNGKGLVTAASTNVVIAPASTLTGTTLNSTVVTSSLTSVGTIGTGVWNGTAIAAANGGTGLTSSGASGNVLTSNGSAWLSIPARIPPTVQRFTSGSGSYVVSTTFAVTSANATVGATYTNNGQTFTVSSTIASGTILVVTGTGSPSASGTLTKSAGTGDATITFSAFYIPLYLHIRAVGGGGGGSGSGSASGGTGTSGGNTTWASTLVVANGGGGGIWASTNAAGGSTSLGTGVVAIASTSGAPGSSGAGIQGNAGGGGASTPLGGGGGGGYISTVGYAAIANTGAGGGGGGAANSASNIGGCGGAAGGYVEALYSVAANLAPGTSTAYAIGSSGGGGTAGTGGVAGGAGGSGLLVFEEHYQ